MQADEARELGEWLLEYKPEDLATLIARVRLEEAEWFIRAFSLEKSVYSPLIQTRIARLRKEANAK